MINKYCPAWLIDVGLVIIVIVGLVIIVILLVPLVIVSWLASAYITLIDTAVELYKWARDNPAP